MKATRKPRRQTPRRAKIIGHRYGKLTIVEFSHLQGRAAAWICRCDCGGITVQDTNRLNRGRVRACETCVRGADLQRRLWGKIDMRGDCWLWTGSVNEHGYGKVSIDAKVQRVHRVVWKLLVGPISDDRELDHTCWTPACCNPGHLRPATHQQNGENRAGAAVHSRSGIRGVHQTHRGTWIASCKSKGQVYRLGTFRTSEEAEQALIRFRAKALPYSFRDQQLA